MNNGFSNISGPTLNGLVDINADTIASSSIATSTIVLNGVDVSAQLNQVPINTGNITALQQITTGQSYSSGTDTTTIDNNVIITGTLTTTPLLASQTYVNNQISALVASAPASLDTLNELALSLGNDASFSTTVLNAISGKVSLTTTETITGTKTFNASTSFGNAISLTSATSGNRQINNTFYNLYQNDAISSGTYKGRIYTNAGTVYFDLNSLTHAFSINNNFGATSYNPLYINPTDFTITTTNCPTMSGFTLPGISDSTSKIATTQWVQSVIPSTTNYLTTNTAQNITATKTFTSVPLCSTAPTTNDMLSNKSYVDNIASQPIGSIVIFSSNTIPTGWLLCNGQLVSTTTYASLFAVIGYTYTLLIPPTTGNFYLPDFTGLYTRGKGLSTTHPGVLPLGQDAIVTSNTVLGEYQMSSPGNHKHFLSTVNTNTQETTGTTTVVSGVSGIPGLILQHQVVSNGVVTTTSTTGSGETTIYTKDTWGTTQANECRPNNISMNYIIKFGGTITPITAPSFTQVTDVLTIQNNFATSGIINFTLDDAASVTSSITTVSGTLKVNASGTNIFQADLTGISTKGIIGQGSVVSQSPTTTNKLLILADAASQKNYIQSSSTNVSGSTCDLIFGGYQNSASYATFNAQGISLNAGQGSYLFGRNDGVAFNTVFANGLYPVGYSFVYLPTLTTFVSGTPLTFTCPTTLAKGVWLVSGWTELSKGTAVFTAASYMRCAINVVSGTNGSTTMTPTASGVGSQYDIGNASTNTLFQCTFATGTVVSVANTCQVAFTNTVVCTVGTATTGVRATFTKIA